MSEQKPDMSKVVVGTMVRYRGGEEAEVREVQEGLGFPFCTGIGIWHTADGLCCLLGEYYRKYDIIEIISHPTANVESPDAGDRMSVPCEEKASLRDLFAMAALCGFTANPDTCSSLNEETTATLCYKSADAMLKARSK